MSKGKHLTPPVEEDGYRALVLAIVKRAVDDAHGQCGVTHGDQAQVRHEARAWLEDETAVAWLLNLAGYDPEPVVGRLRQGH